MFDGNQLEDNRSLGDYNIPCKSTLQMIRPVNCSIFVKTLTGKKFSLGVQREGTVKIVMEQIEVTEDYILSLK